MSGPGTLALRSSPSQPGQRPGRAVADRSAAVAVAVLLSTSAGAAGFSDHGEDLYAREKLEVKLSGYFRLRGDVLSNLDLDRGLTPSGQPLFPVPLADPTAQTLAFADMRLRANVAVYAPWAAMAVKLQLDAIDNLVLGSNPSLTPGTGASPTPAASLGQVPASLFRIKRAYGEALTPFGLLTAGRMGSNWGLGMFANGGDCLDCNSGDNVDRVAFITPLVGHLWAIGYDFSAVLPTATRKDGTRSLVLDPSLSVSSISFAVMSVRDDDGRVRRRRAGKATVEYGAWASYRWQTSDLPAAYLATATGVGLTPSQVVPRGFQSLAVDGWARLTLPKLRLELEGVVLAAQIAQATLLPGALFRDALNSLQLGLALELEAGDPDGAFQGGVKAGIASGDPAPGFGAYPNGSTKPTAGELDAPQLDVPRDTRVDNFRFNPDYRVDRILFNEIIGTVTDAFYVRPFVKYRLVDFSSSRLVVGLAGTFTRALYASSTPGGTADLGVELHPSLTWQSKDGFDVLAEYAVLFPFSGLSNPVSGLDARPAQLFRLRAAWVF